MSAIVHPELGTLSPEITTTAPFHPLNWLRCPGNLAKLQRIAARKYARDCEGRGEDKTAIHAAETLRQHPRKIRAAAVEMAVDAAVSRFLDADYAKLGITDDEPARAVLGAISYVRRARWRHGMDGSSRKDSRKGSPYIGSMASRGDNPAAVASAIEQARKSPRYATGLQSDLAENRARAALTGEVGERKTGNMIQCPGGKAYGETRHMIATGEIGTYVPGEGSQDWNGAEIPFRYRREIRPGGWKMETRKAHKPTEYPAGLVMDTAEAGTEPGTFIPPAIPTAGMPPIPGTELTRKPACPVRAERIAAGDFNGRARVILQG